MDEELKQRLVGAVVLTSLAAIFIPMLFDDPVDPLDRQISTLEIPPLPNDLQEASFSQLPRSRAEVESFDKANSPVTEPSILPRWFVQVGMFSQKTNATKIRDTLKQQGFPVTLTAVKGKTGTLYRVWVGPELDKERAKTMKADIEQLNHIKSILVLAH